MSENGPRLRRDDSRRVILANESNRMTVTNSISSPTSRRSNGMF
jgi:hypothetical protein